MTFCDSCGGVFGRDCFNMIECAQISQNMQYDMQWEDRRYIEHLEQENRALKEEIKKAKEQANEAE